MARLLLTHIVGAAGLEPELAHMTFAANAWVLREVDSSTWLIEAPDVHAFRVCLLPGWALREAWDYPYDEDDIELGEPDEPSDDETTVRGEEPTPAEAEIATMDDRALDEFEQLLYAMGREAHQSDALAESEEQGSLF